MEKTVVDVGYFFETASNDELKEFHDGLVQKNRPSLNGMINLLSSIINDSTRKEEEQLLN